MTFAPDQPTNEIIVEERPHLVLRTFYWLIDRYRPHLGWLVFGVCLLLVGLPAQGLAENRVVELQRIQAGVDWVGPWAVLVTWLLLG